MKIHTYTTLIGVKIYYDFDISLRFSFYWNRKFTEIYLFQITEITEITEIEISFLDHNILGLWSSSSYGWLITTGMRPPYAKKP